MGQKLLFLLLQIWVDWPHWGSRTRTVCPDSTQRAKLKRPSPPLQPSQVTASHVFLRLPFADPFPCLGFTWKVGVMIIMTMQGESRRKVFASVPGHRRNQMFVLIMSIFRTFLACDSPPRARGPKAGVSCRALTVRKDVLGWTAD